MARKGFNPNQPRDASGRFAGGGSGGGRGGGRKPSGTSSRKPASKPRKASKPAGGGRKRNKSSVTTTGTFATRIRARLAQKERTKQFHSKVAVSAAKEAWKKANGERRKAGKVSKGKVTEEQRAIATAMKKAVRSKNVQASRILMKMAALDGHAGDVRGLTSTVASNGKGGWRPVPTRNQRGNQMSAEKNKELMFDRAPSRRLMQAAMNAVDAGRVSQRRLDAVLRASGIDYMAINQGYWRAVDQAKAALSRRRRRSR